MPQPVDKIGAMAAYALADLDAPAGVTPVSLAQNESAYPPAPQAIAAAARAMAEGALYPDPNWTDLRHAIAEVHAIPPEDILCGAGSMELIGALAHAFLDFTRAALVTAHGYLFFRTASQLAGARVDVVPEAALQVDVDTLLAAVRPDTAVVFVANPGNPTGTRLTRTEITRLRAGLAPHILLIVDEAYGEFADGARQPMFDLVDQGNTVVLRTFSKAYALAGMRVGWGLFPPAIRDEVRKVLNPNNISGPAQAAAAAAMRAQGYMRDRVAETTAIRDRFIADARGLGIVIPGSFTNFGLLGFPEPQAAAFADQALRGEGLLMRGMAGYGLPSHLRATIGSAADMDRALAVLARIREGAT